MKVGLIDVDGHNFPNIALMKISAYHKQRGDVVEWWNGFKHYDIVYKSKVFTDTYSNDENTAINADVVIKGGTGYDLKSTLISEIEHQYPDYNLYPQFGEAYGYLTRGCPRGCGFCIVAEKEGKKSVQVADIGEFWKGQKEIKLLDPNILACGEDEKLLQQLIKTGAYIDFTQGIDARLINSDNIKILSKVKKKRIHFAWDDVYDTYTPKSLKMYADICGKNHRKQAVYILTNYNSTHEQDLERIYKVWEMGYSPYVMIYNKPTAPQITRYLQRWANNPFIFKSSPKFEDYNPKIR